MSNILGLKAFLKEAAKYILTYHHRTATPTKQRHDDVWLVEFPKSGITWLSFLLANINLKYSGIDREVNFFNIHDIIPDVGQSRHIRQAWLPFPNFRLIKTHAQYNPNYYKIIYIIRDPRDVMLSYFYFLRKMGVFKKSLSDLISSKQYGIYAWHKHVESWLNNVEPAQRFNVFRFEDLKSKPKDVLIDLYKLLGYELDEDILKFALHQSSFQKMKEYEEYYWKGNPASTSSRICRNGTIGSFKENLSDSDLKLIQEIAGDSMEKFGYTFVV